MTDEVPPANIQSNIAVVGGGIAGIAAALRSRALFPSACITLIEASERLGGKILGENVDGCVIDGGADVCIGNRLRTSSLFNSLDLTHRVIRANPDTLPTYEFRDGYLQRLPNAFSGELLTFPGGMSQLVEIACNALDGIKVLKSERAEAVEAAGGAWRVRLEDATCIKADAVIVATPASVAAALIPRISTDLAASLGRLEYPVTTTATMAWRSADLPHYPDATGYLVADPTAPVSACTFTSKKHPTHAPSDIALIRCYLRNDVMDPIQLMRAEVAAVLGIRTPPLFSRVFRWRSGIPLYTTNHASVVASLNSLIDSTPGIFMAGSAFHGVGIPDCIHSGERAAASASSYLRARPSEAAA